MIPEDHSIPFVLILCSQEKYLIYNFISSENIATQEGMPLQMTCPSCQAPEDPSNIIWNIGIRADELASCEFNSSDLLLQDQNTCSYLTNPHL